MRGADLPTTAAAFRSSGLVAGPSVREIEPIRSCFSHGEYDSRAYSLRQGEPAVVTYLILEGQAKGV